MLNNAVTRMLLPALVVIALAGCTTHYPQVKQKQSYPVEECELVTREFNLKKFEVGRSKAHVLANCIENGPTNCLAGEALLRVFGEIWEGTTYVVSSSIKITGDVIHWVEYQGRCNKGDMDETVGEITDPERV